MAAELYKARGGAGAGAGGAGEVAEALAGASLGGGGAGGAALAHPYNASGGAGRLVVEKLLAGGREGPAVGQEVVAGGWVKTGRIGGGGSLAFVELNDGSCPGNLQLVVKPEAQGLGEGGLGSITAAGSCLVVRGELRESPAGAKQDVELHVLEVLHLGTSDAATYPIAKKKTSFEFLRSKLHLRPRTNTFAAVARVRNALSFATHSFFQEKGFLYVHTPIITTSDCEGAGEMFQISTLLSQAQEAMRGPQVSPEQVEALEARAAAKGEEVKAAKAEQQENPGNKDMKKHTKALVAELLELKAEAEQARQAVACVGGLPWTAEGGIDYSKDFFGQPAHLTVSGQLQGEDFACALTSIYTFGPTFRAENSHTTRHLSEFWMIEPELAFADLNDDMSLAEDYVRYCCQYVLDNCAQDLAFFEKMVDKTCVTRLKQVAETPFVRITYTKAVEMLQEAIKSKKKKFVNNVEWGCDLNSEHERYLAEEVFKGPMVVYDYPKDIKAFYMRLNDDNKTVAAMDILVPGVGELVGGSQREERLDVLERRLSEDGMDIGPYESYLDLRRYGTVKHAGFGLGFERLVMFATGLENIRDVIPFPRWPGHAA